MPNSPGSEAEGRRSGNAAAPEEHPGRPGVADDLNDGSSSLAAVSDEGGPDLSVELARTEDRYRRALADLDNYRKRSAREIERRVAEARERALRDWLDAVDSVERATRIESGGPCAEGMRAVLDQMDAVVARQGAQRIGAVGERFDPERHEAIAVRSAPGVADRTVLAVERSGYELGDRVLRPAQVVVARAPEDAP